METNETLEGAAEIGNFSTSTEFGAHSVWTIVSLSIVYGLLSLTAFVGNTLVIWVICKLDTQVYFHICNLDTQVYFIIVI